MLLKGGGSSGMAPPFLQLGLNAEEDDEFKTDGTNSNHKPPIIDNGIVLFCLLLFLVKFDKNIFYIINPSN